MGTRWHSKSWHCATSQKVACSIPDSISQVFHRLNPYGLSVAVVITQPSTQVSTMEGVSPGGKGGRCISLTTLLPSCADCLEIPRASAFWSPKRICLSFAFAVKDW
jgi:hypothetical protein